MLTSYPPPAVQSVGLETRILREARVQHVRGAYELFKSSSRTHHDFNVIALIDQRDPFPAGWQRVKVVRDADGTTFKSVLSPLNMEGIESIDDGNVWKTLLPDEKMVMWQPSP